MFMPMENKIPEFVHKQSQCEAIRLAPLPVKVRVEVQVWLTDFFIMFHECVSES